MSAGRVLSALLFSAVLGGSQASAHWGLSLHFGGPVCRPFSCHPRYYFAPVPPRIYFAGPPVIVQPVPAVAVAAVPAPAYAVQATSASVNAEPASGAEAVPVATLSPPLRAVRAQRESEDLIGLEDPVPAKRAEAAVALGRRKERQALAALTRLLREDPHAEVREASARALGLIAQPASLSVLQDAAQGDDDREVRKSAAFAAEVIRGNFRR